MNEVGQDSKPNPQLDSQQASKGVNKFDEGAPAAPDTDDGEPYDSRGLAENIVRDVRDVATLGRALDDATRAFGLQVNQQFNISGGLVAPGDVPQERLSEATLTGARDTFVRPGGFALAWDRMLDQDLILLRGRPGFGRECAATHLLDAFCEARVCRLTGGRPADLRADDLTPGYGYIWTGLTADGVGTRQLERVRDLVHERACRMVLIWPRDAVWEHAMAGHYCDLTEFPPFEEILSRHLRHGIGSELEGQAEDLLNDARVVAASARISAADGAAALGRALREVVLGRSEVEEALETAAASTRSAADWFIDLENRTDRVFALALATLNGLPYPVVVSGARTLDERIQRSEDRENRSCIRPFDRPARQLLRAVDAVRRPGTRETAYGVVPTEELVSRRDDYSRRMLSVLWEDYPYLQDIYLEWLDELVKGADPYVRERAAFAAGTFADKDFEYVCRRLLLNWSASDRWTERRAVGTALRVPVLGRRLHQNVWDLLEHWSSPGDTTGDQRRRITAAAALGGPVGVTDVPRALDVIGRKLLERRPGDYVERLWNAVAYTVAELFGDGSTDAGEAVLRHMADWAAWPEAGQRDAAVLALIALFSKPPEEHRAPSVLRAVAAGEDRLVLVADLWRVALNHPTMAGTSVQAFRTLSNNVPDSGEGLDELVWLVGRVPRTRRELNTLRYEVRHWGDPDGPAPAVVKRIAARLDECEVSV
ncbi:hypothetical protein FB565_003355 [Actinoplanes lutulentus]|uniref:Uncharacterized protein n=1 Tax=Actinoplanes lutulentus TaxID=1287878 RepID=A0A327Z0B7_9ACTN|nr:hypothetical protein [Actinoplanes lutulentus]MBB2943626.1 hypothetical protein [Actinoplanes lutulentus]RAK27491.1 hypothetical protein B0I29_123125 [Actinoplanes lutulentus]